MKAKVTFNKPDNTKHTHSNHNRSNMRACLEHCKTTLLAATAGLLLAADPATAAPPPITRIGHIFVIAMENHNFTQPTNQTSPQQIFGNPAAPYINSLVTPGSSNAAQVAYATAYYNAGTGVHPSEPNYVWAEAGTDFGIHTDADPRPANNNIFNAPHLSAQLEDAGISWKNYQEDVQLSTSPTNSASGTSTNITNPYYGTGQYNYAVKHNPMAFFPDTALKHVFPLAQLFDDLANNSMGRYNWITPNQFNDAHSALSGGFTYNGVHYTGDQASVAQGDNFLSQIVPQIMATRAYQDNGVIIIWWDESEGGDDATRTVPEIIISPLAKGNAYASTVEMNHSSDIKTVEEIFGLPAINNPIPLAETNSDGGYNNVAIVNDLSDLFVPGIIPAPAVSVTRSGILQEGRDHHAFQLVFVKNTSDSSVPAPAWLVLDNLTPGVSLANPDGSTQVLAPLGSPCVKIRTGDGDDDRDDMLRPHQTRVIVLEFLNPGGDEIDYDTRVLSVTPAP